MNNSCLHLLPPPYPFPLAHDTQDPMTPTVLLKVAVFEVPPSTSLAVFAPSLDTNPIQGRVSGETAPGIRRSENLQAAGFLTNNFALPASQLRSALGALVGQLFFKWIKMNLRIKSFFGRDPNAVYSRSGAPSLYTLCSL